MARRAPIERIESSMTVSAETVRVLAEFQELCGYTAESKGFHEDRPKEGQALADWQGNKLMLIVSEAVEAHDEIRNGKTSKETYYPTAVYGASVIDDGPFKPEGVPSEIADIVIRCFDFAYTEGFSLAGIIAEKLEYNATRAYKHGKKF